MAAVLTYGAALPVLKVGRIAGQFVKPRTRDVEQTAVGEIPVFRGHMIHDDAPTAEARIPDPERMLEGYHLAASTLNLVRAFTKGGFADLTQVHALEPGLRRSLVPGGALRGARLRDRARARIHGGVRDRPRRDAAAPPGRRLDEPRGAPARLRGGAHPAGLAHGRLVRLLGAHALDRRPDARPSTGRTSSSSPASTTRSAARSGQGATPDDVVELCERLNPERIPGRLTLIARLGAGQVAEALPPLLRAVDEAEHPVVWTCDPMHANGFTTASGRKTRHFDAIMAEIEGFFAACRDEGAWPGGVHLEYTGEDVTECLGGSEELGEEQLDDRYETLCDPRLNGRQSLDLAFRLAELMRRSIVAVTGSRSSAPG